MTLLWPRLDAAGMSQRGPIVLRREEGLFPRMASSLTVDDLLTFGDPAEESGGVDSDLLEKAFGAQVTVGPAAFVAGRVTGPDDIVARLMSALRSVVAAGDPHHLRSDGLGYVEASMALALRGNHDDGHRALLPVVDAEAEVAMGQWLAAYYLAQMGDASGYPALTRLLQSNDDFTRLMGARHLVGFLPYDGQVVATETVDVAGRLAELLDDEDPLVSVEIPGLLAEAGVEGLGPVLERAAKKARHKDTRRAAKSVLESLSR